LICIGGQAASGTLSSMVFRRVAIPVADSTAASIAVFAVYALAMARDEAFATPQIGYVPLGSGEHGNVIGNALFNGGEALVESELV
jgi:hypothetical protein